MLKILVQFDDRTKLDSKTTQFNKSACPLTLFTPNFQFLFTDIFTISKTFCNSGSLGWIIICATKCFSNGEKLIILLVKGSPSPKVLILIHISASSVHHQSIISALSVHHQ